MGCNNSSVAFPMPDYQLQWCSVLPWTGGRYEQKTSYTMGNASARAPVVTAMKAARSIRRNFVLTMKKHHIPAMDVRNAVGSGEVWEFSVRVQKRDLTDRGRTHDAERVLLLLKSKQACPYQWSVPLSRIRFPSQTLRFISMWKAVFWKHGIWIFAERSAVPNGKRADRRF